MPSLAEFQAEVRGAVMGGDASKLVLVGGRDPARRFDIHRRHYETSLARALTEKFPAVAWLVGSEFVTQAARRYVRRHPPRAPCIAEYGQDFPDFLARQSGAERVPWVRWTGELEWHLGHAALAVEHKPFMFESAAAVADAQLPDCTLRLQPGLRYFAAPWPVDELLKLHLSDKAPEQFQLDAEEITLEILGARGSFSMTRLDAGPFTFRQGLAAGSTIGHAAEQALEADPNFDAGGALIALLAGGLVTSMIQPEQGAER